MSHKKLLTFCSIFFVIGTLFLFTKNEEERNPDKEKNWWTLSLLSPKEEENLAFTVENHSTQTDFSYEIMIGKETIAKESFLAKRSEKTTITPPLLRKQSERVRVIVTTGDEKKELYR